MNYRGPTFKRSSAFLTTRVRVLAIIGLTLSTIVVIALVPRTPQDESYHDFADQRSVFGISNFLNVVSNLPFLLTGVAGLVFLTRNGSAASSGSFLNRFERWPYIVFFFGVTLTCFGSAYYHLSPNTDRLMWDRLPMSIAFMSLFATVIAERINLRAGIVSLTPLVIIGVGSVLYWHLGEQSGSGDLRPYVLVQFYSLLAIVLTAILFPSRYTRSGELLVASGFYVLAKLVEILDSRVFAIGRIVSGHTLKHIVAAVAAYWILHMLKHRCELLNRLRRNDELRCEACSLDPRRVNSVPGGITLRDQVASEPAEDASTFPRRTRVREAKPNEASEGGHVDVPRLASPRTWPSL